MKKFEPKQQIYFDHAASAPMDLRVQKVMRAVEDEAFGNPSSLHQWGVRSKQAMSQARKTVAQFLHGHEDEIVFTSGGTESNHIAIHGVLGNVDKPCHVLTSAIEHSSVLEPLKRLSHEGKIELETEPVDAEGIVSAQDFISRVRPETRLVSIMLANNEIGTIQPIADIGRAMMRWRKDNGTQWPRFHVDACQAVTWMDCSIEKLHPDLLSLSGSKMYGPKGVGALFVRRGIQLYPPMIGGGQERGLRVGTENLPGIVGLAKACEIAAASREKDAKHVVKLRDMLIEQLEKIQHVIINGHRTKRLPNNVSVTFSGYEGEALILSLDALGVAVSTGAACSALSEEPSHVLRAIGRTKDEAQSTIRLTFGRNTQASDIHFFLRILPKVLDRLRESRMMERMFQYV